jgi:hypothetical protein
MLRLAKAVFSSALVWLSFGNLCAFASSARTLDLPEIAKQADVIADVTVQNLTSYWSSPGGVRSIHTRVDFSINKVIKGSAASTISLEFLGGEVGDRGTKVPGVPQFSKGERFVIFSHAPGLPFVSPILGLDQGSLRVIHDDESNVDRVFRHWGQPVSEQEDFKSRIAVNQATTNRSYLRSANTVDHFAERVTRLLNP